jgi:hypothetical protein
MNWVVWLTAMVALTFDGLGVLAVVITTPLVGVILAVLSVIGLVTGAATKQGKPRDR